MGIRVFGAVALAAALLGVAMWGGGVSAVVAHTQQSPDGALAKPPLGFARAEPKQTAPLQTAVAALPKAAASTAEVKVDNFNFGPAQLNVTVGTMVTWTNRDDIPHTVVSADGVFKSKVMDTDEKFSFTFSKAGTYPYFCSIHPKMTGTVVVQ